MATALTSLLGRSPDGAQRDPGAVLPDFASLHPGYENESRHRRNLRQMNRAPERLLDQVERVDQHPDAGETAGLELREMRDPQADRLARIQERQRIAQHRGSRIHAQHDGLTIETVDPDVVRDLPDDLE